MVAFVDGDEAARGAARAGHDIEPERSAYAAICDAIFDRKSAVALDLVVFPSGEKRWQELTVTPFGSMSSVSAATSLEWEGAAVERGRVRRSHVGRPVGAGARSVWARPLLPSRG